MDAQDSMLARRVVGHLGAHLVDARDQFACHDQQAFAGRGWLQTARMTLEQWSLELMFEQGQPTTRGRRGDVASLRCAREVTHLGCLHEQGQGIQIGKHRPDYLAKTVCLAQHARRRCRISNSPLIRGSV